MKVVTTALLLQPFVTLGKDSSEREYPSSLLAGAALISLLKITYKAKVEIISNVFFSLSCNYGLLSEFRVDLIFIYLVPRYTYYRDRKYLISRVLQVTFCKHSVYTLFYSK